MELRFLPNTLTSAVSAAGTQQQQHHRHNHHHHQQPPQPPQKHNIHHNNLHLQQQQQNNNFQQQAPTSDFHRRTLDRSTRNIQYSPAVAGVAASSPVSASSTNSGSGSGCGIDKMLTQGAVDSILMNGLPTISDVGHVSSMRRTRRTSGSGGPPPPGSPRVVRGVSSELLNHNRSPMPSRAITGKRNRLGSRTENMSSGSLNSIEV